LDLPSRLAVLKQRINDCLSAPGPRIVYATRLSVREWPGEAPGYGGVTWSPKRFLATAPLRTLIVPKRGGMILSYRRPSSDPWVREYAPDDARGQSFAWLEAIGALEPAEAWQGLAHLEGLGQASLNPTGFRSRPWVYSYLLVSEPHEESVRRFREHLSDISDVLACCRRLDPEGTILPADLLRCALDLSGMEAPHHRFRSTAYYYPLGADARLERADRRPTDEVTRKTPPWELGWPEGDYFFILDGDARLAAVELVNYQLEIWGESSRDLRRGYLREADVPREEVSSVMQGRRGAVEDASRPTPHWNSKSRTLTFGEFLYKVSPLASRVSVLLEAFQSQGWPDHIENPFKSGSRRENERYMRQTVTSLNTTLREKDGPFRLRIRSHRPHWCGRDEEGSSASPPISSISSKISSISRESFQ
jgi:hypothetical protein